jgi:short-subunit dehydrogenase
MAVYHATKAYVLSFSEALHRELGGQGVRVTALCPGPVQTEFMALAGIPEGNFPNFLMRSAERVAQDGYDGLMRGRRIVVPGSVNKAAALLTRLMPRRLVMWMLRTVARSDLK